MPVDWGLPDDDFTGVIDISAMDEDEKKAQIEEYEGELDKELHYFFNTEALSSLLKKRNQNLRRCVGCKLEHPAALSNVSIPATI